VKIWAKTKEFFEGKFLVVRRDGTVPAWPHFVLGARDPHAVLALMAYATSYLSITPPEKFDREYYESILELARDFELYRLEHGDGDPEAAPHRKDDPGVINAMRHGPGGRVEVKLVVD
jgi:hypothetical protein